MKLLERSCLEANKNLCTVKFGLIYKMEKGVLEKNMFMLLKLRFQTLVLYLQLCEPDVMEQGEVPLLI